MIFWNSWGGWRRNPYDDGPPPPPPY
jgi:hypothetical protein